MTVSSQTIVKQGTIVCHVCEKEIEAVDNDGVKIWYGICDECADKKKKE